MTETIDKEQKFVLKLGDLQEILNYLSSRPYAEVFNVVETLKKAQTMTSVLAEQEAKERAEEAAAFNPNPVDLKTAENTKA